MKIGILTYFGDTNPGTNLQAYTLFKVISEFYRLQNPVIEIINYQTFKRTNRPFYSSATPVSIFKDFIRIKKYKRFREDNFCYSTPHLMTNNYENAKEYLLKQKYDLIYIGSDTCLELQYADKSGVTIFWIPSDVEAKKVMIAVSARNTQFESLTVEQKKKMMSCLKDVDHIAVRDDATKRLIEHLVAGKRILKIPDPTFAFEIDYSYADRYFIGKKILQREKLICIHLTRNFKWGRSFANIARKNGFRIVSLRPCRYADYELNDLSPLEYAGIFKFFTAVVTHRFHDTVFSLKNLTPIVTVLPSEIYSNDFGESKYQSVLKDFDLLDSNYIDNTSQVDASFVFEKLTDVMRTFDKNAIQLHLDYCKKAVIDFLILSLTERSDRK